MKAGGSTLGNGEWDLPELRKLLEDILPRKTTMTDFRVDYDAPDAGRRTCLLNAHQLAADDRESGLILLAVEDITGRKG